VEASGPLGALDCLLNLALQGSIVAKTGRVEADLKESCLFLEGVLGLECVALVVLLHTGRVLDA